MSEELKCDNYIVAVVDILGGTDLIMKGDGLEIIHKEYLRTINSFKKQNPKYETGVRIFSDNILFYLKVSQYADPIVNLRNRTLHMMKLSASVSGFQSRLMLQNIYVRGGLTYGSFFVDDVMVWGMALVRAHELESQLAIYPRIILDPQIKLDRSIFREDVEAASSKVLFKDNDGLEFLNFSYYLAKSSDVVEDVKKNVIGEIEKNKTKDKVVQKYEWLNAFLNRDISK